MQPTTRDYIIAFLLSSRSIKIYRKLLWERVYSRQKNLNVGAFNQLIYRLRKKGILESRNDQIYIHRDNLLKFSVKNNLIIKNVLPDRTEKVLISFDIPEKKKKTRDWLRNQIKYWEFKMIQKSLWLGYGPLPREFTNRLRQLEIHENVRIFRIKKTT